MAPGAGAAREEILGRVRASLGRAGAVASATPSPVPPSARIPRSVPAEPGAALALLLDEIVELGGRVRRLAPDADLLVPLREVVEAEQVTRAVIWGTPPLRALALAEALASLGVAVVPPDAGLEQVAACDLGITGVDAALPETGTLLLRAGPDCRRAASLLPRVHLALLTPAALRADLTEVLAECRDTACATLITGPSRTSDIELTLTIGVHGPKALYVWVLESG